MQAEYGLRSYYEYLEKEWEAHGSWEVMPERDRSSSLLRATPPFPCIHCRFTYQKRTLHNLQQLYIAGSAPWASKTLPAGPEDVTDNTSSSRSSLSSAAVEREMKNSFFLSLKLIRKLHLRSPQTQSLHYLSSGWTRAAGGRWSPQFSRENGTTESGAFSHRKKAHNERTPFPREQSARALRPNT